MMCLEDGAQLDVAQDGHDVTRGQCSQLELDVPQDSTKIAVFNPVIMLPGVKLLRYDTWVFIDLLVTGQLSLLTVVVESLLNQPTLPRNPSLSGEWRLWVIAETEESLVGSLGKPSIKKCIFWVFVPKSGIPPSPPPIWDS